MKVGPYAAPDMVSYPDMVDDGEKQDEVLKQWDEKDALAGHPKSLKDNFDWSKNAVSSAKNNFNYEPKKPSDNSSALLVRLVAATGQFEVRQVIADASKDLVELRITAAMSKGKDAELANAAVAKLEKLISRAQTKIKDLNKEDDMKLQHTKAKRQKLEKRAEEIKEELRKHIQKRKEKENKWLLEDMREQGIGNVQSGSVTEAEIAALAEAMAAAEMTAAGYSSVEAGFGDMGGAGTEGPAGVSAEVGGGAEASVSPE